MKIYVINLPQDLARRESVSRQMVTLGLEFELVTGVLGKALSGAERSRGYDRRKALRIQCRDLAPAEIGIALSHLAVYRRLVEDRVGVALVLEDDVIVPPELPTVLEALEPLLSPDEPSVTLLSPAQVRDAPGARVTGHHRIQPFRAGYYTHGYVVTNAAARALLRFLYPVGDVADCWKRLVRHKVVDIQVVVPPLLQQDQDTFGSSSTEGVRSMGVGTRLLGKAVFKARRAFWLGCDACLAAYNRHVRPYAGVVTRPLAPPPH